jgi:hypothetical protein
MSVSCEYCVFSGRGLCVGLITHTEEHYGVWCFWVWSWSLDNEETLAQVRLLHHGKQSCYFRCCHRDVKNMWRYTSKFVRVGLYFLSSQTISHHYFYSKDDITRTRTAQTCACTAGWESLIWTVYLFWKRESCITWKGNVKSLCQCDYLLALYTFPSRRDVTDWTLKSV